MLSSVVASSSQVNVYVLGKTFLLLARELCINAPAIGTVGLAGGPQPGRSVEWEGVLCRDRSFSRQEGGSEREPRARRFGGYLWLECSVPVVSPWQV